MEHYDPEKTARVWQRVQSSGGYGNDSYWNMPAPQPPLPPEPTLEELIAGELEAAATYERLARRYTNPERTRLLQIARQERAHAAFLRALLPRGRR